MRLLAVPLALLLTASVAHSDETMLPKAKKLDTASSAAPATTAANKPQSLYLTQHDFQLLVLNHPNLLSQPTKNLEEIIVSGKYEQLPVHEPTREIPGGLLAPFWAIAHPTQAWRIFLPIPPK